MKFKLDIEKKNKGNIGQCEGHNERHHATASQLPKEAWITPEGCHVMVPFNKDLLKKAKDLSVRKDSVFAIELLVQVGNQTDWRDMPDEQNPCGKKLPGASAKLNAIMRGVREAAEAEFGKDRIVSMAMHTDESTPHVHILFVPIVDGKLNQKNWVNGAGACASLRERIYSHVNKHIPCEYEKGVPKGAPHDPSKAAGAINGPKAKPTMLEKASDLLGKNSEIKALKALVSGLNQQLQNMFSRLKKAEKHAEKEVALREKAIEKAKEMHALTQTQKLEIKRLELEIQALQPEPLPMPSRPQESPAKAFLDSLSTPPKVKDSNQAEI